LGLTRFIKEEVKQAVEPLGTKIEDNNKVLEMKIEDNNKVSY
jgi:hypothetical protein